MTTPQGPYPGSDPWSGPPSGAGRHSDSGQPNGQGPGYYPQPGYPQPTYSQPAYTPPSYPQGGSGGPGGSGSYGVPAYPGYGAAGYGPAPYGSAGYGAPPPGYPGVAPVPMERPTRPGSVAAAFWLWMLVFVLGVLSTVLLFSSDYFAAIEAAVNRTQGLDAGTAQAALAVGKSVVMGIAIASAAIGLFIYLFFGLKMYVGRNWARIVLTVLGGLSVLSGLSGAAMSGVDGVSVARPDAVSAVTWIQVVVAAIGIILMWLSASNRYFRDSKIYRASSRQLRV